ncbi:hypothetical protein CQW23_25268 [Capsicum baccatum]|uniref:Uncharacterized protein n=1 Tax=Capsicum baccatum TaxID=33114 RepID=A0A2G2VKH6_CAPBA|nr:hypothetical protein CQW23_25268 [Capsicum baccatum]
MVDEKVAVAVPLVMLAEKEENADTREFFDVVKGVTYTMNFPELARKHCLGVGIPGWLFGSSTLLISLISSFDFL